MATCVISPIKDTGHLGREMPYHGGIPFRRFHPERVKPPRSQSDSCIKFHEIHVKPEILKSHYEVSKLLSNQNKNLCGELKQLKCEKFKARLRGIASLREVNRLTKTESQLLILKSELNEKIRNLNKMVQDSRTLVLESRMQALDYSQRNNNLSKKLYSCQVEICKLSRKHRSKKKKLPVNRPRTGNHSRSKSPLNCSPLLMNMMKRRMSLKDNANARGQSESESAQSHRIKMNTTIDVARVQKKSTSLKSDFAEFSRKFKRDFREVEARICKRIQESTYDREMQLAMLQMEAVRDMNLPLIYKKLEFAGTKVGNLKHQTYWGWRNVSIEVLPRYFTMIVREKKMKTQHSLMSVECVRKDECRFSLHRKIGKSKETVIEDFKCQTRETCTEWTNYFRCIFE